MVRLTISLIIVVSMFAQFSDAEIDPESIVGAWLFDETNGKVAKDSSGNGNDGNLVGGAKWAKGKFGNAIELNGKDAWVTVPRNGTARRLYAHQMVQFNRESWRVEMFF